MTCLFHSNTRLNKIIYESQNKFNYVLVMIREKYCKHTCTDYNTILSFPPTFLLNEPTTEDFNVNISDYVNNKAFNFHQIDI